VCGGARTTAAATASWGLVSADCTVAMADSCFGNSSSTAAAGAVVFCSVGVTLAGLDGRLSSLLQTRYSSRLSGTRPVE